MTIQPTIGILTALPKEYAAMKALLVAPTDDYVPGRGAGRRYCVGEIPASDGGKHTVVLSLAGVGNNSASSRATLLLEHFQTVDSIVMIGIAGGAPNPSKVEEHVRLGDIVVSDKGGVVQYGFGKEVATTNGDETTVAFEHRSPPRPPSAYLLESVGLLEAAEIYGDRPWIYHIANTLERFDVVRPQADTDILVSTTDPTIVIDHPHDPSRIGGQPRLFTGTIASENILLKNPVKRDYLRDKFGVKAIEMEGSGIADASWNAGVGYLVVRGICDYCDSNKGNDWQMYAAIVAAGYVRALIESMPTNITRTPDPQDKALGITTHLSPEQYVQAVEAFSETTPYLSLHQLLAEEGETQVDSYVPLLLQPESVPAGTSSVSSPSPKQFFVGYDSLSTKEKESLHTEEPKSEDEKTPRLLSAVMSDQHDPPYVLFVAPGGAGKSTLLRQIARLAWDAPGSIGLERRYLPMVIRLSAFAATEGIVAEKKLREAINKAGEISVLHELPDGFFSDWPLQTGAPWILLFDGLDEVPKEQRVTVIAQLLSLLETIKATGYRVAITSRPEEFLKQLESRFQKYRVLGFDSQQQREFANHWFGADADEFLNEVSNLHAADISSSPLLLTIAAVVFRKDRQLLKKKVFLYRRFVEIWLDEAEKRGLKNELGDELFELVPTGLEHLALKMTDQPGEGSFVALRRVIAAYFSSVLGVAQPKALAQAKKFIETLGLRSGVFIKNGEACDWVHANLREYLAACAMESQLVLSMGDYLTVLGERPFDPDWRDVVINLIQLFEKPEDLLQWLATQAAIKDNADSSLLVYEYWKHSNTQDDPELCKSIVGLLVKGLGDWQARPYDREMLKAALVEMGSLAVPALLEALNKLNALQAEILPDWNKKRPPDIHGEVGNRIYKGYKQRRGIIGVLGKIKDVTTLQHLIVFLRDEEKDSYRREIRDAAQRALTCIGMDSVPPLVALIRDRDRPLEERHQALVALKLVGLRTELVSATLDECFREGLSGNGELLRWSLFAATGLRDQQQSKHAHDALRFPDQEVVAEAAGFFTSMPDESAFIGLGDALLSWHELKTHPFSNDFAMKRVLSALLATSNPFAQRISLLVVAASLRGNGELRPYEALRTCEGFAIKGSRQLILTELLSQLRRPSTDFRVIDALEVLSNTWRPHELSELVNTARRIERAVKSVGVGTLISYLQSSEDDSLRVLLEETALLYTLAKCEVRDFPEEAARLLEAADWDFLRELSDVLWIAGDSTAEEALILKLKQVEAEKGTAANSHWERYHLLRALGTCGNQDGVEAIIQSVLRDPDVNVELSQEVLWPLLKRGVLKPDRLISLAENSSVTHQFARNFFVEALGSFNAPSFTDFFCNMLSDDDERVKANAAHFLSWSKDTKAVALLEDLLRVTQSPFIAETCARSLVKLKGAGAVDDISAAIPRFGPAQREGLIREAARLRDSSVVGYLRNTTRMNEWSPRAHGDILNAVGEFYEEPWARRILEDWLEDEPGRFDTGQQRWAFRVLARHDPNRLLEQATRLYDDDSLEDSAQSVLINLLPRLARSELTNPDLLSPLLKRFLCDQNIVVRESVAESLGDINPSLRFQIYTDLSLMGNDWAKACAVYSLGFWDSDESELEINRLSRTFVVRYFADLASTMRRNRIELRALADMFIVSEGSARVSSYLSLAREGTDEFLHYINDNLPKHSIGFLFLNALGKEMEPRIKRRREDLAKKEMELFCESHRQVEFKKP